MPVIPTFPDVPDVPGVPQVPRDPQAPKVVPAIPANMSMANEPTTAKYWGVFDDTGADRLLPDTIVTIKDAEKTKVSNFPVEQGSFATYNKVVEPFDIHLLLTKSESVQDRSDFLDKLTALKNGTDLLHVVTPERTFMSATLVGFDYSQKVGDGQNMIKANCHFTEVRQVAPAYGSAKMPAKKVKSPSAADKKEEGKKQPNRLEAAHNKNVPDRLKKGVG